MATYVGSSNIAHAKGGCYICGGANGLVDTDVQIEGEGALAICRVDIHDLAQAADLTFNDAYVRELQAELLRRSPDGIEAVEADLAVADAAVAYLTAALGVATSKIDALTEALRPAAPKPAPKATKAASA